MKKIIFSTLLIFAMVFTFTFSPNLEARSIMAGDYYGKENNISNTIDFDKMKEQLRTIDAQKLISSTTSSNHYVYPNVSPEVRETFGKYYDSLIANINNSELVAAIKNVYADLKLNFDLDNFPTFE